MPLFDPAPHYPRDAIVGVILAGGQSLRMGRDKASLAWGDSTLLQAVCDRFAPQVGQLLISFSGPNRESPLPPLRQPHSLVFDKHPGQGPLSGILAALEALKQMPAAYQYLAVTSCDTPNQRPDWVGQLFQLQQPRSYVRWRQRHHYTQALWSRQCLPALAAEFAAGTRALKHLLQPPQGQAWADPAEEDSFININTPEQLAQAQALRHTPEQQP
jgi:molybdenum cofactor guanylyltransferase